MLILEHISKRYSRNGKLAVDDLSLQIKPGEIFGFIGSNGAGKTTTIKMMTGIIKPDEGYIEIFGSKMQESPIESKKKIGYVPDNHEIYERLKGIEYLHFLADIYNVSADELKRIDNLAELFNLNDALHEPIKSYSHGMKQKLCLIGALLHQPPLWILDEPMTGLDPQSSHNLKQLMRQHCDAGNIVFFSTHVLDVAERLCDRVGIIQDGQLIAVGTLDELRSSSQSETLEDLFLTLVSDV